MRDNNAPKITAFNMSGVALCYARKSMVRNAVDEISPARQRSAIVAEAERRNLAHEMYEDAEGHRSGRTERRPGWLALKARLDDPSVRAVIVESLSRASRSVRDLHNLLFELERRGIALVSLKEQIDTSTAMGRAFVGFIAVMNQFESDITSERMKMTIAYRRDAHKLHFGLAPFGCVYRQSDHALIASSEGVWRIGQSIVVGSADRMPCADATRAQWFGYLDAVRVCFEIYSTSKIGFIECAERLNAQGFYYRDRHGLPRKFERDDVRRIIAAAPLYAGNITNGRAKDARGVVIAEAHAPILDPGLCARLMQVHAARHDQFAHGGGGSPKRVYLLPDLFCGECGARMKGQFQSAHRYYRHAYTKKKCAQTAYVRADVVEPQVLARLARFDAPREMKERIRNKARALAKQATNPAYANARDAITKLEAKLERLREMYVEGEFSKAEYTKRKNKLSAQIVEAQTQLHDAPTDVRALERLLPQVDHIADVIAQGEPARQREVIASLFERCEVRDGKITLARVREWARPFFNGDIESIERGMSK